MTLLSGSDRAYVRDTAETSFSDTCNIFRNEPTEDGQGGFADEWSIVWAEVPCRFSLASNRTSAVGEGIVHVQQFRLSIAYDQEIRVGDRVQIPLNSAEEYEVSGVSANTFDTAKRATLIALI